MSKAFFIIFILYMAISNVNNEFLKINLKQNSDYLIKMVEGILDSFTKVVDREDFPLIKNCLESDIHIQNSYEVLLKSIKDFKGTEITTVNLFDIFVKFGNLLSKMRMKYNFCFKKTSKELSYITNEIEKFFMNFPSNFKIYLTNFNNHKIEVFSIIEKIKKEISTGGIAPYELGYEVGTIINLLIQNGNYKDEGLESFQEFELFNDCFGNVLNGIFSGQTSFQSIFQFVNKQENIEDLFYKLANLFEILSNQVDYCDKYYKHLFNI